MSVSHINRRNKLPNGQIGDIHGRLLECPETQSFPPKKEVYPFYNGWSRSNLLHYDKIGKTSRLLGPLIRRHNKN